MRKICALAFIGSLALISTGCIIVASERCHKVKLEGDKRLVEIDGEVYVIDVEEGTAKRFPQQGNMNVTIETEK